MHVCVRVCVYQIGVLLSFAVKDCDLCSTSGKERDTSVNSELLQTRK